MLSPRQPLAGVSFGLYNQAGEQLQIQKTNSKGVAEFIVEQGTWQIIEVSALDGYAPSGKVITVEVGSDYVNGDPIVVENTPHCPDRYGRRLALAFPCSGCLMHIVRCRCFHPLS